MATIIVRAAAELTIKGNRVRHAFHRAVEERVRAALTRRAITAELAWSYERLFVATDSPGEASAALTRVFGVGSLSPLCASVPAELEAIVVAGVEAFAPVVRGKRYAVRVKRRGEHAFGSKQLERDLGAALWDAAVAGGGRVDLTAPEVTVEVEVLGKRAHLFCERVMGPGGLPGSVQGRALTLMSGGFDSAVASWRIMKRGVAVDWVFCNLGGGAYERLVLGVCKVLAELWCYGHRPMLHVVDFRSVVAELRERVGSGYWQVALKRLMYLAAASVAREIEAEAIVTGESLGQVSSQTIANLHVLDSAPLFEDNSSLPVLRPLVGADKVEIVAEARRIGTAQLSERVKEYCALGATQPVIAARPWKLRSAVARIDPETVRAAVRGRKIIDVLAASADDLRTGYLFTREIPSGALIIDCRPAPAARADQVPGSLQRDPGELLEQLSTLDKDRTYVLYCTHGSLAASVTAVMQQSGFEAYAFEGGVDELKRRLAPSR
jgi:thiamine biosynthesis protein ThiI